MNTGIDVVRDAATVSRVRTILLVDDEENILSAMRRVLRREGYQILTAGGGKEGLALLADNAVDVIVSDQRMPNMTGVEFLRQAKVLYPDTVRIVLSGYTELQSITDAINEGAIYKFLTKPWDDELIRANIAEAFRHKELGDENHRLSSELAQANQSLRSLLAEKEHRMVLDEASLDIAREVLHSIPLAILGIDNDGFVVFSNLEADFLFFNGEVLLGEAAKSVLPPEIIALIDSDAAAQLLWQSKDGLKSVLCRSMGEQSLSRGRLLILLPHESGECDVK